MFWSSNNDASMIKKLDYCLKDLFFLSLNYKVEFYPIVGNCPGLDFQDPPTGK